jgi:predicted dehydrogenase
LIRVAVAGAGQWGRNHVRVLASLPGARLTWVVDPDAQRRAVAARVAPDARLARDIGEALGDEHLDAVVIASPGPTHGAIARAALEAGKHVLCEKPLTPRADEAWGLVRLARRLDRVLGVGHLLLYHPALGVLRREVARASFGAVRYIHCQRTNIGRVRHDESALTSLAPHDLSVMVDLLGRWPTAVSALGARHVQPRWEDVVFLALRFPGGVLGHIHLSWLEPLKVRRVSVVGERAMAVFDDMAASHPIEVVPAPRTDAGRFPPRIRRPAVGRAEPLAEELRAFLRAVRTGRPMPTPGEDGARVARVLEAAQRSLEEGGHEVALRIR